MMINYDDSGSALSNLVQFQAISGGDHHLIFDASSLNASKTAAFTPSLVME